MTEPSKKEVNDQLKKIADSNLSALFFIDP